MSLIEERNISITARCGILFGGVLNQFGWFFLGFGLIFFWGFATKADFSFIHFQGEVVTVEGIATEWLETNVSINETPVIENRYKFTSEDGIEFEDFSYSTGRSVEVGKPVAVEYPKGKPKYSRIVGMKRQPFGLFVLLVAIFPLAGLVLILAGIKKSRRTLKLLKYGKITTGKLVSKVRTNTQINDQTVYKLTFCFGDEAGNAYDVTERTHRCHLLEDDSEERLLYLSQDPNCATMIDSLCSAVSIDDEGKVTSKAPLKAFCSLLIPLATIWGHGFHIIEMIK